MQIAINTDFFTSTGSPQPILKAIAEAGFTHLHWCHQWNTDFHYDDSEIAQIKKWLDEYGLSLLDIHGSDGREKCWYSTVEYERQAGVALVANRIKMLAALKGTGAVMMHIAYIRRGITKPEDAPIVWQKINALKKSINELMPLMRSLNVPLALENTPNDTFETLENVMGTFPKEFVGLCYDSGHGNIGECEGLNHLEDNKGRLMALHLHDNNGTGDQHQPPFMGNLDWNRLADIIARSAYPRQISFEVAMRCTPFEDIPMFLKDTYTRCAKFVKMVEERKLAISN